MCIPQEQPCRSRDLLPVVQGRKLLQIDFLSRVAAKGLLPPAAQKWNIGALAYFIFFVQCAHL